MANPIRRFIERRARKRIHVLRDAADGIVKDIIRLQNVTKILRGRAVLDDVSLGIEKGKTTFIIGQSGVGKSVLLKNIIGLMKPDLGRVFYRDVDLSEASQVELNQVRKHFGMLFQQCALFNSLTVGENVAFPIRQDRKHISEDEVEKIVAEKLAQVGMPNTMDMMPAELSGGMKKRVALARAIALDPEVVIFDEPTTGLDPVTSDAVNNLILRTQKELGMTYVVISHDIAGTLKTADNIGMLYKGKLVAYGSKEEIRDSSNEIIQQFFRGDSINGPIRVL